MGSSQSCVDCRRVVPLTVRVVDNLWEGNGIKLYNFFTKITWAKHKDKYLCPDCLIKRQKNERKKEEEKQKEEQRRQHMAAEAERQRKEAEAERQRKEAEAERQRKEAEAERQRKEAEAEGQRKEAERQRKEAEAERQRKEAEAERQRKEAEEERQRKEAEAERQRKEAESERQRKEAERQRKEAEAERQRKKAEAERQRKEAEAERQRKEAERQRKEAEAERQRKEVERQRKEAESERKRKEAEVERQRKEVEAERQRQEAEAERQRKEAEAERQRKEAEAERKRKEAEAECQRQEAEAERQRKEVEAERQRKNAKREQNKEIAETQCTDSKTSVDSVSAWLEKTKQEQNLKYSNKNKTIQTKFFMEKRCESTSNREYYAANNMNNPDVIHATEVTAQNGFTTEETNGQGHLTNSANANATYTTRVNTQTTNEISSVSCLMPTAAKSDEFPITRDILETESFSTTSSCESTSHPREVSISYVSQYLLQENCSASNLSPETIYRCSTDILSEILKIYNSEPEACVKLSEKVRIKLKKSTVHDVHIVMFAMFCVLNEQQSKQMYGHTLDIYEKYACRQQKHRKNDFTIAVLLGKMCDALLVLYLDERFVRVNAMVKNVLKYFYLLFRDKSALGSDEKDLISFIETELKWQIKDLLSLLWYAVNKKGNCKDLLAIISSYKLNPNMEVTRHRSVCDLLLDSSEEDATRLLKSVCEEEPSKTVEIVLEEITNICKHEISGDFDSQNIERVWTLTVKIISGYGYPKGLEKSLTGKQPSVNLSVFETPLEDKGMADVLLAERIAEIFLGVQITKRYWPRSTQFVSLCLLISSIGQGKLLEVNTGEGKTCIVAMFAVFLAMSKRFVDVISSSPILAARDSNEWDTFYELFGLSCGENLTPNDNSTRKECYKMSVVYGTVGSFASDILREEFLMENTREKRRFDAVIVDEVDCLLLDNSVNCTYLSHEIPGMHHIEPILLTIWNEIVRHPSIKSDEEQPFLVGKAEPVHVLLSKLIEDIPDGDDKNVPLGILKHFEEIGILRQGFTADFQEHKPLNGMETHPLSELDKTSIVCCLKYFEDEEIKFQIFEMIDERTIKQIKENKNESTEKFLFENAIKVIVIGNGLVCQLYDEKQILFDVIKSKIEDMLCLDQEHRNRDQNSQYTECPKHNDKSTYEIPSYLLSLIKDRLPNWIENAFKAEKEMLNGRDYLITDTDIVPVDFESTGVVELDTKWGDGLHQFLEIKHSKKMSPMTVVTNFMSNQGFFKRYPKKIFWVSGTLGSHSEKSYLQRAFDLTCVKIPTHNRKKFSELPGKLCICRKEWEKCILEIVKKCASEYQRTVLIICEDINAANGIKIYLQNSGCKSLTMITRNDEDENKDIKKKKFFQEGT